MALGAGDAGRYNAAMVAPAASRHVSRDENHLAWDPAIPPVARVASGEVVEFDCLDASFGQLTADSTHASLADLDFARVDQVTGPVAVEGAEPGDTLQIDLLEFEPADWGWTASIPGFGLLADDFPDGYYKVTRLQPGAERVEFWPGVRIPLAPFCGVVGVAPVAGPLSTIPPDVHGGNMDTRHLVAGSTLFLPVFQPGAGISVGDGPDPPPCAPRIGRSPRRCARRPESRRCRAWWEEVKSGAVRSSQRRGRPLWFALLGRVTASPATRRARHLGRPGDACGAGRRWSMVLICCQQSRYAGGGGNWLSSAVSSRVSEAVHATDDGA